MNILLVTPPLTQLNTPYPATTQLASFMEQHGYTVQQTDLGIELINAIYTPAFLTRLFDSVTPAKRNKAYLQHREQYINTVEAAMRFLRGQDQSLANRIAARTLLPEGPRFNEMADLDYAFGNTGIIDKAKHVATLFVEDIADFIRIEITPHFALIRYAESIVAAATTFEQIEAGLTKPNTIVDNLIVDLFQQKVEACTPDLVGFSIPFPGCLYAALKCAQWLRQHQPHTQVVLGGGYVNTELRQITDPGIFGYVHYLCLDDGELPLLHIAKHIGGECATTDLVRTYYLQQGKVCYSGNDRQQVDFATLPTPSFRGLPIDRYISLLELVNPMHKLWTDGQWNKMTLAHGCYWAKCSFCDTSLDYIARYKAPKAPAIVDKMEQIMQQTGSSGFHFTDEALPPHLLHEVSAEIVRRGLTLSYWGNIRFERMYTPELCAVMAQAGCIAVSGGLEVASDRLLAVMNKGVSLEQAIRSAQHLTAQGIMVHAYLMYGFPTQTLQETIDALEVVRQMFAQGLLQSGFWHRFSLTTHSPIAAQPAQYGVQQVEHSTHPFANNDLPYTAPPYDIDHEAIGKALHKATHNYMHDIGIDYPLQFWFPFDIPKPGIHRKFVERILDKQDKS